MRQGARAARYHSCYLHLFIRRRHATGTVVAGYWRAAKGGCLAGKFNDTSFILPNCITSGFPHSQKASARPPARTMGLILEAALNAAFGGDPRTENQCPDFQMLKELERQISTAAEEGIQQAAGGTGTDNSSGSGSGVSSASSQASGGNSVPTVVKEGALIRIDNAGKRVNRFYQLVDKGPSSKGDAQLVLLAFKKDPNLPKLQPPPVGAADSASAR